MVWKGSFSLSNLCDNCTGNTLTLSLPPTFAACDAGLVCRKHIWIVYGCNVLTLNQWTDLKERHREDDFYLAYLFDDPN